MIRVTSVSTGLLLLGTFSACVYGIVNSKQATEMSGQSTDDAGASADDEEDADALSGNTMEPPSRESDGGSGPDRSDSGQTFKPPPWSDEFAVNNGLWELIIKQPTGAIQFGFPDPTAADRNVVSLLLPAGDATVMPMDRVGSDFSTGLRYKNYSAYGTYRTRLRLPQCSSNEGVTSNWYLYQPDSNDSDGNKIPDATYIQMWVPCGQPLIKMSVWTDYDYDSGKFVALYRSIDTSTGTYSESISDRVYDEIIKSMVPEFKILGFPDPNKFYEMGIEWHATKVRFSIVTDHGEITLWEMTDPKHVPHIPARFRFEVQHEASFANWPNRARDVSNANYPQHDAALLVDWIRYTAD